MTLGEWLESWLELYVYPADLAENTKKCYNRAVRAVPPGLASTQLGELSPLQLRRWLLQVAKVHPRAAQLDRRVMLMALSLACKAGEAPKALSDPDLLPEIKHKAAKADVLSAAQLQRYFAAALHAEHGVPLALMACGLRRGEALGARWEALDLAAGTLAVVGQRLPGCHELAPLKSAASYRVIELPPQLILSLRRMPRPIGGGWLCDASPTTLYKEHAQLLRQLSLPDVTLHGLRHSFATAAVQQGVPIKVLQSALGHAKYQLTADLYADHLPLVSTVSRSVFTA